jgi:HEPN domain-containing protein
MLELLQPRIDIPLEIRDEARLLDLYYIPPRYPNGFASGKPADYFTQRQAKEAMIAAGKILRFCESYFTESD